VACLPDTAFAGRRFLDLRPHHVEVVGGRDHGEENDQNASQSQQALQRRECSTPAGPFGAPEQVSGQRQEQPSEIEQQFHETKVGERAKELPKG